MKNYYYFIAGILAVFFSITHELNGQLSIIPTLSNGNLDVNIVTTFTYIWHIITAENLLFGIAFIIMAFYRNEQKVRFTALVISTILMVRLLVIVGVTLAKTGSIKGLLIDIIAILIYTSIILLGARKKKQSKTYSKEQL